MIEIGLLGLVAVIGVFWVLAALVGVVFKLTFGLLGAMLGAFGALLGGMVGLLGLGIAALVVLPILALALLPLLLPVLFIAGIVWLIVRASRPTPASIRH